jgi:hypothetical protein
MDGGRIRVMKRFMVGILDWIVGVAAIALIWNASVPGISLGLIAACTYLFVRFKSKFKSPAIAQTTPATNENYVSPESEEDNAFLVDNEDPVRVTIELDVDLKWKPQKNHFRLNSRVDTCFSKSLYEYRIDGTEVFLRLIEDESEDIGRPEERDVRDGVVQESAIRERSANTKHYMRNPDEKITSLKQQVEWQRLDSSAFRGFKYFLLSKKLAKPDARRFFRQELERLKIGTAGFFREAEKYGLEKGDQSPYYSLRFAECKPRPTDEEIKRLYESTESFGISQSEFESGKNLMALLERLLGD